MHCLYRIFVCFCRSYFTSICIRNTEYVCVVDFMHFVASSNKRNCGSSNSIRLLFVSTWFDYVVA